MNTLKINSTTIQTNALDITQTNGSTILSSRSDPLIILMKSRASSERGFTYIDTDGLSYSLEDLALD